MGWLKEIFKDSAVAICVAVITGGSGLAAIVWLWKYIVSFFDLLVFFLTYRINIPVWFLILMVVSFYITNKLIDFITKEDNKSTPNQQDPWEEVLNYTEDHFFGMDVSWQWRRKLHDNTYECRDIVKRCPKCHGVLTEGIYDYPRIQCVTVACSWKLDRRNEAKELAEIRMLIEREIDRKSYIKLRSINVADN